MQAAGILYKAADTGRVLLLRRTDKVSHVGRWGLPGGHLEPGESTWDAAARESGEEIGVIPDADALLSYWISPTEYTVFIVEVPEEFHVKLFGDEHDSYQWAGQSSLPGPIMPHLRGFIKRTALGGDFSIDERIAALSAFVE